MALTPMEPALGGLVIAPGSHRELASHRWIGDHATMEAPPSQMRLAAEPGDVLLFSSLLPHMTLPNDGSGTRLAYVAEFLLIDYPDHSVAPPHLVLTRHGHVMGVSRT